MLKAAKLLAKNIMGQPTGPDELVLNRKDNSKVVVEIFTYPVKIKGKTLVLGIARDITERKQAEAELLVKNDVFEASITANSTSDNEGILTYVNSAFIKIFGYENKEEAVGKPISDFLKFEYEAMNIITALNKTGVWEGEYTALRKDGTTFTAYGLATTIKGRSQVRGQYWLPVCRYGYLGPEANGGKPKGI
jgi:PAS domain S-box-containing protein